MPVGEHTFWKWPFLHLPLGMGPYEANPVREMIEILVTGIMRYLQGRNRMARNNGPYDHDPLEGRWDHLHLSAGRRGRSDDAGTCLMNEELPRVDAALDHGWYTPTFTA
jgi:hypothetical protein